MRARGPVYGTGEYAEYVVATCRTLSPVLALRWLRGQAVRVADLLDPDPTTSPWVRPGMRTETTTPVPDCPTELRTWAADLTAQYEARRQLKDGVPVLAAFTDTDCAYAFTARPTRWTAEHVRRVEPEPVVHRIGGLAHPLYAATEVVPWR
ncbi:hypothetical protein [Streptomyces phytohabitans]|uniref:hypothetical protein n=1 Tax=Streptomyces phytohabitans TaxID=1150371 RepID=UPI00345B58A7